MPPPAADMIEHVPQTLLITLGSLLAAGVPDAPHPQHHVDLGPEHPSRTGSLVAQVTVDGGVVTTARLQPGWNHRSAEKLFEVRDYRQVLVLADRHDWHSPITGELGIALAAEHLMGLQPPVRATWIRTLLAEQARIASHLGHLSFVGFRLDQSEISDQVRQLREQGRRLVLAISGNRVHPMLTRLGGIAIDPDAASLAAVRHWAAATADTSRRISHLVQKSELGAEIAITVPDFIDAHGLGGPVARAAGLARDLRTEPHLAYGELDLVPVTTTGGDARARFLQLCDEVAQSAALVEACQQRLVDLPGPVDTKLSKIVKLPDAECYVALEAPWGPAGFHIVSRAERTPWRLRLRTPSLANVQALESLLVGTRLDDVDIALASMGWTAGDLDK